MRRREWVRSSENVKIKSSEGTSHQPYEKCHVDGAGETLSSLLPPDIDQSQSQSQGQSQRLNRTRRRQQRTPKASPVEGAEGVASMRRRGHRQCKLSAASPSRYPQVGKTVEGDEIEEVKTSH